MPDYYQYQTDKGIIVADVSTIQADVEAEFKGIFGAEFDLTASTPQGRLIEEIVTERSAVVEINAENANQINFNYATGIFLDAIGSRFNVKRVGVSSTRVLATVNGTAGTVIPANSTAKTTADDLYYAENAITIPSSGSITSYFLSSVKGAIACEIGTLTKIVSGTSGWTSISNPVAATIGTDQESDASYYLRIKEGRTTGSGFLSSIKAKLDAVDNIVSSFVYDNGTSSAVWYDGSVAGDGGLEIPANSIVVIADGGTDADIAQAAFDTKSSGCGYMAITASNAGTDQSTVVNIIDGQFSVTYPVTINRPYDVALDVEITVRAGNYSGDDLEQAVKDAITTWAAGEVEGVDGLNIASDASPFEIAAAVSYQLPSVYVSDCKIALTGGTAAATTISIKASQIARIDAGDITVTIV